MLSLEENKYWVWFSYLKLNNKTATKLIKKYKTPKQIYNLTEKELINSQILKNEDIYHILRNKNLDILKRYIKYMNEKNIKIITIFDKEYPFKLKNIYDSPLWLYFIGNYKLLNKKSIAIIGSRNCTNYGKNVAKQLAKCITQNNKIIISGLAKGIDSYAHIGTMNKNASTIAVLGNGLDMIYPKENTNLANEILKKDGLILSEYIIGTKPEKNNFPKRNRIISGLSDIIIVVEAEEKSGSLITVDLALEQGKDIYAIPGSIYSKNSRGTNKMIRDGAGVITSIEDIL